MKLIALSVRVGVGAAVLVSLSSCSSDAPAKAATTTTLPATAGSTTTATTATAPAATNTTAATPTTKPAGAPGGAVVYELSGRAGVVTISGEVKDISKPFDVTVATPNGPATATATPNDGDPMNGKIAGTSSGGGTLVVTTNGKYTLKPAADGYTGTGTVTSCIGVGGCASSDLTMTLKPKK